MRLKETKGEALIGCLVTLFALFIIFPLWVYVIRSILVRGEATDFEWFVFYAYIAGHVLSGVFGVAIRMMLAVEN